MTYPKKLIEVALPLEAINKESAREKSIRHGHPSTLHLWWARRPLAAARAVLFSSLVDDPSEYIEDDEKQKEERERLFQLIEELVKWENINNDKVLDKAKLEIARSVARNLGEPMPVGKQAIEEFLATKTPPVLDPFAGGGTIPLEAQRLGLRAYASDLNPVAVLINKALIEIPPKFANMPPVHPPEEGKGQTDLFTKEWKGVEGLAEDVRYYGQWMRDEAEKRIGHLYPKVKITQEMLDERGDLREKGVKVGEEVTPVAWFWTRTVECVNPACKAKTPLVKSFWLSRKAGAKEWIEPIIDNDLSKPTLDFSIRFEGQPQVKGTVSRNGAKCIACQTSIPLEYIRQKGRNGKLFDRLMGVLVRKDKIRFTLAANRLSEPEFDNIDTVWKPELEMPKKHRNFQTPGYGIETIGDLFSKRQLLSLNTFNGLVKEVPKEIQKSQKNADNKLFEEYSKSIVTYLALAGSKIADRNSTIATWDIGSTSLRSTFSRQAIPMTWDYCEVNPFETMGSFEGAIDWIWRLLKNLPATSEGKVSKADATDIQSYQQGIIVSMDPPYYDNIAYADLADYFYVWLRRSLGNIYPELFVTIATPKSSELVAISNRFDGDKTKAKEFFEVGLHSVFTNIHSVVQDDVPVTIFYAFKQTESDNEGQIASTGWETFLDSLISVGFHITSTWPMRTELSNRVVASESNALASSIILSCRKRDSTIAQISYRDLYVVLKRELPLAIEKLKQGYIAPVDLAQASIGPGMSIFSRFDNVLEANGDPMTVRSALSLINQVLDEFLAESEGDFDSDTRWAVAWYEQYGHEQSDFGVAETLSKAKNTSIDGLVQSGILESRAGKVRLLHRDELDVNWTPEDDKRLTTWEAAQYLIRTLDQKGEQDAAELLARLGAIAEPARELVYRLYTICERKGWAQDALGYNMLVVAWPRLKDLVSKISIESQTSFL